MKKVRGHAKVEKTKRVREVRVPAFGNLLKRLREKRFGKKYAVESVVKHLREKEGIRANAPSLRGYELGWTERPDLIVLAGLARLYRIGVDELIAVLSANCAQRNLSESDVEQILRKARAHNHGQAAAARRFAELRPRLIEISSELGGWAAEAAEFADPASNNRLGESTSEDRRRTPSTDSSD